MSLIISGHILCRPADRDQLLADLAPHTAASRDEPGCIGYALYADPVEDDRIGVFEHWESEEALRGHFSMAAFEGARAIFGAAEGITTEVQKHQISSSGDVFD